MSERLERIKEMLERTEEAPTDDEFVDVWVRREAALLDPEEFEEFGRWLKAQEELAFSSAELAAAEGARFQEIRTYLHEGETVGDAFHRFPRDLQEWLISISPPEEREELRGRIGPTES